MFYIHCNLFVAGHLVKNSPAPLTYRDVFVLTTDPNLHDDVRDDKGNVTSGASGFVQELRAAGIPVGVLERIPRVDCVAGWKERVADVGLAKTDKVTVAHCDSVHGLERRVVVWLTDGEWEARDFGPIFPLFRLRGLSRCTTQLVVVDLPSDDHNTEDSTDNTDTPQPSDDHNTEDSTDNTDKRK